MKIHLYIAVALACGILPSTAFASKGHDDGQEGDHHGGNGQQADPNETVARGPITAISTTEIDVGGLVFVIDGSTVLKGKDDAVVDTTAFAVGDIVKVEGVTNAGILTATEIELEDDHSSTEDNHHSHGGLKSNLVIGKCTFPSLDLARQSLEKSIRTSFSDAGVTAKVKVKFKIASKDASQEFTGASGANGAVLAVDPASGASVTLSGAILPIACQGTVTARIEVRPSGAADSTVSTATLPITGEFTSKDKGHN